MISDLDAVLAAQATYHEAPTWTGLGFNQSIQVNRSEVDGLSVIAFRGSVAALDWALDFTAGPSFDLEPSLSQSVGLVHSGFLEAARSVRAAVQDGVGIKPYALVGHSLGGALALLVGAMLAKRGAPPAQVITFGAPRVGFYRYVGALAPIPIRQFRYADDPVPAVPPPPYMHARLPLVPLGPTPKIGLRYLCELLRQRAAMAELVRTAFACHHIENYANAIAANSPAPAAAAT